MSFIKYFFNMYCPKKVILYIAQTINIWNLLKKGEYFLVLFALENSMIKKKSMNILTSNRWGLSKNIKGLVQGFHLTRG